MDKLLNPHSKGTATAQFGGKTGVYTLKVKYHDESDGQSAFELRAGNQRYQWTANGRYPDNYPTPKNAVVRAFENVVLTTGSKITLIGTKSKGERARIDHIDYELTSGATPTPTPSITPSPFPNRTPTVGRQTLQAESFRLNGFTTENSGAASGNRLIKTSGTGNATTTFTGGSGTYDIKVNYFDEADGQAPLSLKAGGRHFNWTANQQLSGTVATTQNRTSRTFKNIQLQQGSTIELGGNVNKKNMLGLIPLNSFQPIHLPPALRPHLVPLNRTSFLPHPLTKTRRPMGNSR